MDNSKQEALSEGRAFPHTVNMEVGMSGTDFLASSRPQIARAAPMRRGPSGALRRLSVLPVGLLLAVALVVPTTAFAAEGTAGYGQTPPPPSTGTTPAPSAGTAPSQEKSTPTEATAPTTSSAPAAGASPATAKIAKASTLPFTGFDLRWTFGIGLILMAAGFSIVMMQRRHRRDTGR
jgi:hypothetical protein